MNTTEANCVEFVKSLLRLIEDDRGFFASPCDDDIMDLAVGHGLARKAIYDPEEHGYIREAEPGSPVYIWTIEL